MLKTLPTKRLAYGIYKLLKIGAFYLRVKTDKAHTIPISRHPPIRTKGLELKARLIIGTPHHYGIPVLYTGLDLAPDMLPNFPGVVTYVDTGPDFQEPHSQAAPQPGWSVFKNDDQHRRFHPG